MRTKLMTTAAFLGLGMCAIAWGQQTEPQGDQTSEPAGRREQRVENRDERQDDRQDARVARRETRDEKQDDKDRQENRQVRREQIRERLQANQDGRRPIDVVFSLVDRIVDTATSADVANADLPQVQETYALLRQFDRDNNGQITHDELVAGQKIAHQQRAAGTFVRLDTNKDSKISREEMTAGQFAGSFEQMDRNQDGFVDRDELTASYTAMRDRPAILRDGKAKATTPNPDQPQD